MVRLKTEKDKRHKSELEYNKKKQAIFLEKMNLQKKYKKTYDKKNTFCKFRQDVNNNREKEKNNSQIRTSQSRSNKGLKIYK
jgi:hypothetical protein